MNEKTLLWIKISLIVAFLFLAIGLEQVYRDPLFTYSLTWEKQWQSGSSATLNNFFKVITDFGVYPYFPLLAIFILWFPITKSYSFIAVLIYSSYFVNLLKIIYANPRPFWVDNTLYKTCDGGFGNPSGHSTSSTAVYMATWHLVTDFSFFKKSNFGIFLRYFLLILFLLLIVAIILSRLFLGVHSINQILYGSTLGFSIYYIIFHVFGFYRMDGTKFFSIFRNKLYTIYYSIWYSALIVVALLVYFLVKNDTSKWTPVLNSLCPNLNSYRKFNDDGLFQILIICGLIGTHYGIQLLAYLTSYRYAQKEDEINNWYITGLIGNVYKILLFILFAIPIFPIAAVPNTASIEIIFTFKSSIPYLLTLFNIFGPFIFTILILKIGNPDIYNLKIIKPKHNESEKIEFNNRLGIEIV